MTINDLIKELQEIPDWRKKKDILVIAPNGELLTPVIKPTIIDRFDPLNLSEDNVKYTVISWY